MTGRARIRVKAMAFLPNAAAAHHAVLRGSDRATAGPSTGCSAAGDVVPAEGGLHDDVGVPMWVEWRRCDEDDPAALPLYPDGVEAKLSLG